MDIHLASLSEEDIRGYPSELLDLAYRKVDGLLRSYGMRNTWYRHLRTREILVQAIRESDGSGDLERRVGELAQASVDAWFEKLAQASGFHSGHDRLERIRLAVLHEHFCERWPESFLAGELNAEAVASLAAFRMQPSPPLERSTLGPSTLDFGTAESVAEHARTVVHRWPVLRAVLFYGVMTLLAYIIYIFAR